MEVHRASAQAVRVGRRLAVELTARGPLSAGPGPRQLKGVALHLGYRADFVVDNTILLELKTVERLIPLHRAQAITYLKLLGLRQGLIFNFNSERLVDGVRNILL